MGIEVCKSGDRAYFNYEWLKTYHTFSFGQYEDPHRQGFRSLRVINENHVRPAVGFPVEGRKDMEMFSFVVQGGIAHQDDLGNGSILHKGDIQLLSAGTGVTHAETNTSDKEYAHFLQIWILPQSLSLKPSYQEKHFPIASTRNQWRLILSPDGQDGSLHIHQDVKVYWINLEKEQSLHYDLASNRYGWIQMIEGALLVNDQLLESGDGAAISHISTLGLKAQEACEFLFFDLN